MDNGAWTRKKLLQQDQWDFHVQDRDWLGRIGNSTNETTILEYLNAPQNPTRNTQIEHKTI